MKGKQMQEEIKNYLLMVRAERKKAGITKVPEFDARDVKLAYGAGLQSGLWHHSHDYLVKTAGNKEKYMNRITELEAQIEKMKNCKNCLYQGECDLSGYEECKNFDKWEIKEKMTKEELKQEAEEYALEKCKECYMCNSEENGERLYCAKFESRKEGYIAGAEPREKRIEELIALINAERERQEKCDDVHLRTIADLEKENAELKESNKMLEQGYVWHDYDAGEDCYEDSHEGKWVKRDEVYQLTKAKELVKEMSKSLFLAKGIVRDLIDDTVDFKESKERATYCYKQESFDAYKKAEQFLSEVEK